MATTTDWPGRLTAGIADQIRHWRKQRGMSAEKLSAACTEEAGVDIPRALIADLESHRRAHISVAEWLAIARALQVAPLLLICPVGIEKEMEVLPGQVRTPYDAGAWISASTPFPGPDDQAYISAIAGDWLHTTHGAMDIYRAYDQSMLSELRSLSRADVMEKSALEAATDAEREALTAGAAALREKAGKDRDDMERVRAFAIRQGILPPG